MRYPKYKESGFDWIGDIPEHWEVKVIKRLSIVRRGASPRPIANPKYFDKSGEWAWVRIADVSASERYLEKTTQVLSELGASLSVKMLPNSFFLSIAGTVGKPIITKIKCCIHDGFVYFPKLKLNSEYLYYIFSTGQPYQGLGKWGTQLNLNTDTVGEITIPIPSKIEITTIVNYLDRKTAEIDKLITQKEQLLKLYEEEKTAIINQAVTGKASITKKQKTKYKESGVEWLGKIPKHWEVKKLKYVLESQNHRRIPLSGTERGAMMEKEYDYYGASGIIDKVENYIFDEQLILIGEDGANLLTRSKRLVFIAKGKYWVNNHAHILKSKYGLIEYYSELLELYDFSIWVSGSAQPKLTSENLMNIDIIVPPLKEQTQIVQYIETETARINTKTEKTKKLIELLKEYKTALISEVVTGKVKVF